jgi:hypothetical protein
MPQGNSQCLAPRIVGAIGFETKADLPGVQTELAQSAILDSVLFTAASMGLTHCPLCMGLALLCTVRCSAHALLLWRLA